MNQFDRNDERSPERKGDLEAQPDQLGHDSGEVGEASAGRGGEMQRISHTEETDNQSVEDLAETGQALEADTVDGLEDAADHPERPVHTHEEYGTPDDVPPRKRDDEAA